MKEKMMKRVLAVSLSLAVAVSMVPTQVSAAALTGSFTKLVKEKEDIKTYKTKVTLPGITTKTKIKSLSIKQDGKKYTYDEKDLETKSNGELILYLPANEKGKETVVVVNEVTFSGKVTDDNKAELKEEKKSDKPQETEKAAEKPQEAEVSADNIVAKAPQTEEDNVNKEEKAAEDDKLTLAPISFDAVEYGYGVRPSAKNLVITNTDTTKSIKIQDVEISSGEAFDLVTTGVSFPVELTTVAPGNKLDKITLQPKAGLKAGTYEATITVKYLEADAPEGTAPKIQTQKVSFAVNKKTLNVTFSAEDITYGETNVPVTAAISGVLSGDNVALKTNSIDGTISDANVGNDKKVTISNEELGKLELTGTSEKNYQLGTLSPDVKISVIAKKVTVTVEVDKTKTYDKTKTVGGSFKLDGVLKDDKVTATGKIETPKKDRGTYTSVFVSDIKLIGEGNEKNYVLEETSFTHKTEVVVKQAEAADTKKLNIASYTYNSIKVKSVKGQEYAITKSADTEEDELTWKSTKETYITFDKLAASTKYTVITRVAETNNNKASKVAAYEEKEVTTLRNPVTADPSRSSISGITDKGTYKVSNKITFTATGASTGMTSASLDDVQYVPKSWSTTSTGTSATWNSSPYTGEFTPSKSGTYTLEVTYRKEKYNGSSWVDQNSDYVKKITYTVNSTGKSSSGTNGTGSTSGNGKTTSGVKTGDESPIALLIGILIVCVGAFAGIGIFSVKKKKKNK